MKLVFAMSAISRSVWHLQPIRRLKPRIAQQVGHHTASKYDVVGKGMHALFGSLLQKYWAKWEEVYQQYIK